jgi:4-amino-4-deoxy-L-arabinose transferase-like glycosyltransferase
VNARWVLVALLGDFLLAALAFGALIPVFEQPDEHTHYFFAQHVAQTGELPVQAAEQDARGPWEQEGSQPPLYYLLAAPLLRLAGDDLAADGLWYNDQNTMGMPALAGNENRFIHDPAREGWPWRGYILAAHLGRLLSSLFGLITVLSVYLVARRVLGGRAWLGIAAAALTAFNPQFLAVSSTFGNDALIIALSSAALALLLVVWDQLEAGAEPADLARTVPMLAVIVGLAPLAKISGLTLLAFTVGTLAWLSWRRRSWTILAATLGPVLLAAALLAGWWYLRNLRLYGDLLGFSRMHPGGTLREGFTWLIWLRREAFGELKGVWLSSWGLFGWFTILLPAWVYAAITTLCAGSLAALALWGRRLRGLDRHRLAWLTLWAALVTASLLRWLSITKGGQGRLLFPALAAGAVLLVAGLAAALGRRRAAGWSQGFHRSHKSHRSHLADRGHGTYGTYETHETDDRRLALGLYAIMFLFAAACLFGVIRPAYAAPKRIALAELPADALPAGVVFGEGLKLVALQRPERVRAGEDFAVTLYWQVERAITRDGLVALELAGQVEESVDSVMGFGSDPLLAYPGAGSLPPRLLEPGDGVYVDRRVLTAPDPSVMPVAPAGVDLRVSLYDPAAKASWPLRGASDASVWSAPGLVIDADPLWVRREPLPGDLVARFGNGVALHWYSGSAAEQTGKRLDLPPMDQGVLMYGWQSPVTWVVDEAPGEALQLFVHLLDAQGVQLATFDRPLETRAHYPSRHWRAGEVLADRIGWNLFRWNAPTGKAEAVHRPGARFTVLIGLYRPGDGSRIPAFAPDGRRLKDDAVVLHEIEVTGP